MLFVKRQGLYLNLLNWIQESTTALALNEGENRFAVVDGRYKIVKFDNPKYLIKTKRGDA